MNSEFIYLERIGQDSLMIKGLELYLDYYSENFKEDEFRYEDTVTINLVTYCTSQDDAIYSEYVVNDHSNPKDDVTVYKFKSDGLVRISHIILPTYDWFEKYTLEFGDPSEFFNYIYIYDNNQVYKYKNGNFHKVPVEEALEINGFSGVAMTRTETYAFNLSFLESCFIDKYKDFLHKVCPLNKCADSNDKLLDLVFMGIHTIKYYLSLHRYFDAQRILEALEGCNGVCAHTAFKQLHKLNCGCSKKP